MGLIYLVRKKKFRTAEGIRELYFAIQRKLQKRGGKNEEDLAEILSANSSRSKGEVLSILTDLPDVIEEILKNGGMKRSQPSDSPFFNISSITSIRGLGSFHASITSNGFEHPEDVLPHEVRVSKVYFIADRKFTQRVSRMKFFRYPLSKYFPKDLLRPETIREEETREEEPEFIPDDDE